MKKYLILFTAIISLFLLTAFEAKEERTYTIDQVNIEATIDESGIIHVQEQFTYTFHGEFNGMTRSIQSEIHDFTAFLVDESQSEATDNITEFEPLSVEQDSETNQYRIYTKSIDETKTVLYDYTIHGSVNKYTDIGKLHYSFFDRSNSSDLHNVTIKLQLANNHHPDEIHFFLRDDGDGMLNKENDYLIYENNLIKAGDDAYITFLFPASALTKMDLTKDKLMLEQLLNAEAEWKEREENLQYNLNKFKPVIFGLFIVIIVITGLILLIHPIRYRGIKSEEDLIELLERTDPLFIRYLKQSQTIGHQGIIAALFSLKKRKVIQFERIPSMLNEDEETYRFTWINERKKLDLADNYLKSWLFVDDSEKGKSFLLENIIDNPDEKEEVRRKKGKKFDQQLKEWEKLVIERPEYNGIRHRYRLFEWISLLFVLFSSSIFYYFITIDMVTQQQQTSLKAFIVFTTLVIIFLSRYKLALLFYYILVIIMSFIFFSLTGIGIWTIVFYFVTLTLTLIIPSYYWSDDVKEIKYAIKTADNLIWNRRYPIGSNINTVENRLMYAIILDMGSEYAEQCKEDTTIKPLSAHHTLLSEPKFFADTFSTYNIAFYSAIALSTTNSTSTTVSTTSTPTGGGGAGAF